MLRVNYKNAIPMLERELKLVFLHLIKASPDYGLIPLLD